MRAYRRGTKVIKILVVDDEKKLVDLIKGYLEQEGYSVLTAFDGQAALQIALLAILSRHPGRVFTRSQLLEQVWGQDYYDEHIIEVHIGNLRKKLGEGPNQTGYIETIRGLGYRFDKRYTQ